MPPISHCAFEQLYRKTAGPLWAYVYRVTGNAADADDIVQNAFCRLLTANVGALSDEEQRKYLFRVAGNLIADRWRRAQRDRAHSLDPPLQCARDETEPDDDIAKTFLRLKPRDRVLLWLAYVEEHSHREIAATLGVRRGSVKVLLARARARLRDLLKPSSMAGGRS